MYSYFIKSYEKNRNVCQMRDLLNTGGNVFLVCSYSQTYKQQIVGRQTADSRQKSSRQVRDRQQGDIAERERTDRQLRKGRIKSTKCR